jgi:hypothetical protein
MSWSMIGARILAEVRQHHHNSVSCVSTNADTNFVSSQAGYNFGCSHYEKTRTAMTYGSIVYL